MYIENFRNPIYLENGWIDCEIEHPQFGWIPFTCAPDDDGASFDTRELYDRMVDSGTVSPFVPPTPEEIYLQAANFVRGKRDRLLQVDVDPIVSNPLRWGSLSAEKQQEYIDYRQLLLDIPNQESFPFDVVWPLKPM